MNDTMGPRWRTKVVLGMALLAVLGGAGCSLSGLVNSDELPKDVSDPALTQTPDGARNAYYGTLAQFGAGFNNSVLETAILSDELHHSHDVDDVDARVLPDGSDVSALYPSLQKIRGDASQAIGLLTHYLADQPALAGHLYALQGYAEVLLAEAFCSGIPLSTLDFNGDYTYRPGSSTASVLAHAVALFDTALTLAGDSARFADLARVGQARALLGMGQYAAAAVAAAAVPDEYRYNVSYTKDSVLSINTIGRSVVIRSVNFAQTITDSSRSSGWPYTVLDREGFNGLDWGTSGDPRTKITQLASADSRGNVLYTYDHPDKYATDGSSPIVLASGIEARLIEAEVALQLGDPITWLAKLNYLRQTAWPTIQDCSSGTCLPGATGPLPDTTDPGTVNARVDLLFRERAFWLFLTGHRQGDLRRLVGQYGRAQSAVYPTGAYTGAASAPAFYGSDITLPIPATEFANPLYTGCASRGA